MRPLLVFIIAVLFCSTALGQQSTWYPTPERNKPGTEGPTCPPNKDKPFSAIPKDADIDKNGKIDRYLGEFRWDDKKGNDLRVEVWCMDDAYFSLRVYQSTSGTDKLVATPGGKDPDTGATLADPGMC